MKKYLLSVLFLIFAFFYIFLIPVKIYKKKLFYIDKIFEINSVTSTNLTPDGYFYSEKECGYFSTDHGMIFLKKIIEENKYIFANGIFFIEYEKTGNYLDIYSNNGFLLKKIESFGYPYIPDELSYFFILKSNAAGFSLLSIDGEYIIKEKNFNSIITSLNINKSLNTLVSTIDGKSYLIGKQGETVFTAENNGSEYMIAKSNTISSEGDKIAICSGINPEYIEIFDINEHKLMIKFKTNTNHRYESFIKFFNNRLYYEGHESLNYYDIKKNKFGSLTIKGQIEEVKFIKDKILIYSMEKGYKYIYVFSEKNSILCYKEFSDNISDFNFIDENSFYFKLNYYILKMVYGEIT